MIAAADTIQTRADLVGPNLERHRLAQPGRPSQMTVAQRIGVTQQEIDRWEKSKCEPRLPTLKRLAVLYGVHWTAFYSNTSETCTEAP